MAKVLPFRAARFDSRKIRNISSVICPPYDVISESEKNSLKRMHPANIIRLELPEAQGKLDRYQNALKDLELFVKKGYLKTDNFPCTYVYEQEFSVFGKKLKRKGLFAAVKVEKPNKGGIVPHEKTFSGPKEDRLKMMKALKMNISPIFLIFSDEKGKITGVINKKSALRPDVSARDASGTVHRLWVVSEGDLNSLISKELASKTLLIADGHHRYETAWNYSVLKNKQDTPLKKYACNYVLSYLCPMQQQGLVILPTHRIVETAGQEEENLIKNNISKYFTIKKTGSLEGLHARINSKANAAKTCFGFVTSKAAYLICGIKDLSRLSDLKGCSDACRNLDVSLLHGTVLKGVKKESIKYTKDYKDLRVSDAGRKSPVFGFMLRAASMNDVMKIAEHKESMPEKTTYFYPKLATGLIMKSLEGEL